MKGVRIWALLAAVLLVSLACSLGGGGVAEQTPPPSEVGEQPPQEGPTAEEEAPLELATDALSGLDSYRAHVEWEWAPEGGQKERVIIEQEETRNPPARRYVVQSDEGEAIELVQIENTTWLCTGGTCSQTEQSAEEAALTFGEGAFVDIYDLYGSAEGHEFLGSETVNGVSTRHYRLLLPDAVAAALSRGDVLEAESEVWIADQAGLPSFVVRFLLYVKAGGEEPGELRYSQDVYDVNKPIVIEPPAEATSFPEDVPQYPTAQNTVISQGMIFFSTPDDVAAVADFYQNGLTGMGWALQSDQEMSGMVMQTWTKDGRSLQLTISPGEGETSVSIMLGE